MPSSQLRTVVVLVASLGAAAALGGVPARSAVAEHISLAQKGTIKGSVKMPARARRDVFTSTAYVARLDKPGAIRPVALSRRGTFKAKVTPGLYSVVTSAYARRAPRATASVVLVRSGRTVRTRASRLRARPVRVSVGRFSPPARADADASYFSRGLSDLMIPDLFDQLRSVGSCRKDVRIYEDRKYGRFRDILKELRLEASRFATPETRTRARAALRNLPKHAPTLRVMGSVRSLSATSATGQVRVVHIKSGRTVFRRDISSPSAFDLSVDAAAAVAKFLCDVQVDTMPEALVGDFSGSVDTGTQVLTWNGSVTKTFTADDPHTGFTYLDSAHYRTTAASVTWQLTGRCNGGGTLALTDLSTDFYDSTIDWRATAGKGWGYELGLAPAYQTRAMLAPCPPTDTGPSLPYDAATLVGGGGGALMENSDTRGAETNRFSPDKVAFRGSLSIDPGFAQTWTWNLAGSGEVPVPAGAGD